MAEWIRTHILNGAPRIFMNEKISVIQHMKMFSEHRKKYPITKRLGMIISDALSVMFLAHIKINQPIFSSS